MKFILLVFSFLLGSVVMAQDAKAQGILDKLSKKIKDQKSFYVEFSSSVKSASGNTKTETGKGWVKGNKYAAQFGDNQIISNGLKTWTILKSKKEVYESDASDSENDATNPKKLMTIWESGFKNKYLKETTLNNKKVHVITLTPKDAKKANYHTITVYIGKDDNELKKVEMKGKDQSISTYTMTKFTSNPTVEDTKFVFDKTKFPGYKVIKD